MLIQGVSGATHTCLSQQTHAALEGMRWLSFLSADGLPSDPLQSCYESWLSLVDHLNIKAFVNLTLADSVRHGVQNLLFITGFGRQVYLIAVQCWFQLNFDNVSHGEALQLSKMQIWYLCLCQGGMRPNTIVLGFYDDCTPQDNLQGKILVSTGYGLDTVCPTKDPTEHRSPFFPSVRGAEEDKDLQEEEYVSLIADAVKMGKNVTLARYFDQFNREEVLGSGRKIAGHQSMTGPFVDVWPLNLLQPDSHGYVDICSLFLLQLACVLQETRTWNQARLRLFLCVEAGCSLQEEEESKLRVMLKKLRISAQVQMVTWDEVVALHWQRQGGREKGNLAECAQSEEKMEQEERAQNEDGNEMFPNNAAQLTEEYICAVNNLILRHGAPRPAVRFLYLPCPPADINRYRAYLHQLDLLSRDLGPTLLIHGVTPVVTTDL